MTKVVGVHKVVCTCGKDMIRTGGCFGEYFSSTYACCTCSKAVNVIELSNEAVKELFEGMGWKYNAL